MAHEEQLVAEQVVSLEDQHALTVRISQHPEEDFWRVDVTSPSSARGHHTTTASPGDNFLMNLIEGALKGEQVAWRHLAQWGQANLTRPASGPGALLA